MNEHDHEGKKRRAPPVRDKDEHRVRLDVSVQPIAVAVTHTHDLSDRVFELLAGFVLGPRIRGVFTRLHFPQLNLTLTGELKMNVQLEAEQTVDATAAFLDRRGRPARVENPTWSSSDDAIASVAQDAADPLKATVTAVAIGDAIVTCSADADLDEGEVRSIDLVGTVLVREAEAVTGEVTFGTPADTTPPPAP